MVSPLQHGKIFKLGHSEIFLRSDGIIQLNCGDDVTYEIAQIKENLDCIRKIGEGKKLPVLNIAGKYTNLTRETREFIAKAEFSIDCISAEAYVLRSRSEEHTSELQSRLH